MEEEVAADGSDGESEERAQAEDTAPEAEEILPHVELPELQAARAASLELLELQATRAASLQG